MTRPPATGSGLRGPGQDVFPEQARQTGRNLGLEREGEAIQILAETQTVDAGGATDTSYTAQGSPVRGRIDPLGTGGTAERGDQLSEASSHIASFYNDVNVTVEHRLEDSEGTIWIVTAEQDRTDELIHRVEVTQL